MKSFRFAVPQVSWPDGVAELRSDVRTFLREEVDRGRFMPRCDAWVAGHDPAFSQDLGRRGWLGMTWPDRYGGGNESELARFVVLEELLAAGAPVAAHWIAERQTGPLLLRIGSEGQKMKFLPGIARGEVYFSIGMSEPDSGSDLASIQTTATKNGSGSWTITGRKIWTSHAAHNQHMLTLCRTSKEDDRHKGMSQFIVDLTLAGVDIRPIRSMSGESHFTEIFLDDVEVDEDALVGTEGEGWAQVTSELALERSGPERFLSTLPLLLHAIDHLETSKLEWVSTELGVLVAKLLSIRTLSVSVAASLASGGTPNTEAAVVKDLGTRFESEVIETVRRLSVAVDDWEARLSLEAMTGDALLSSPGFTLRGGTSEILRGIIARGLGMR